MRTEVYTKIDQKLINDWMDLWKNSSQANYANSPYWLLSVLESFHYTDFAIIAVYKDDRLAAVAPLIKEKKYGIVVYTAAPSDFVCGIPFLLDGQESSLLQILVAKFLELGIMTFANLPEYFVDQLQQYTPFLDKTLQTVNLFLAVRKDVDGAIIIPNRSKLLRGIRGKEEKFHLRTFNDTSEGLDIVFDLDCHSRKQGKGYSTFANQVTKDFYKSLATHFQENLRINILYFEGIPIAYEIGFLVGSTYFGSQIAFISEYAQYSPGKVLLVKLIDSLGAKNIETVDFGSGDSSVKRLFTQEYRQLYQMVIAKSKFKRDYLKFVSKSKNTIYSQLHRHTKIYSLYRKLRKSVPSPFRRHFEGR